MEGKNCISNQTDHQGIEKKIKRGKEKINDNRIIYKKSFAQKEKSKGSSDIQRQLWDKGKDKTKFTKHKIRDGARMVIYNFVYVCQYY